MSTKLANHSKTSRQIKESSGHTARPAPGEAASPWQAIYTLQHDNQWALPPEGAGSNHTASGLETLSSCPRLQHYGEQSMD